MRFRVVGDWPLDSAAVNAYGTPWRRALVERKRVDVEDVATCGLTQGARDGLLSARVRAVFVRPIRDVGGEVVAVFVTFRRETGTPNSNQDEHLDDACGLAGLAIAQVRRRIEIENGPLTDAMTGIANRTSLNERLESDRRGADALFVDLDHFKSINDMFGTQIGDQVLVEAAHRIAASIRRNDTVYRTGVDEFVVVCEPSGDDPAQRIAIAERLISRLMAPFDVGDHRIRIAASVGIAQALDAGLNATVRAANSAMLTAKESGRAGWRHAMPPTPAVVGATA